MVDGLPVGMMLVAKAFDEETIYRAAAAFENGFDWKGLRAG
jgi:amidase